MHGNWRRPKGSETTGAEAEDNEVIKECWQMGYEYTAEFHTTRQDSSVLGPNCKEIQEGKLELKSKPKWTSETEEMRQTFYASLFTFNAHLSFSTTMWNSVTRVDYK